MALLGPSTDYTDKDFDALRLRLRSLISSVFPEWTDADTANFANLLVELFAFVGDVLTKYQDNQAAEAFIGRVTQRRNILALCKLIGFVPRGNTVSTVDLAVSCSPAPTGTLTIPERTKARTEAIVDPVVFETLSALVFPPAVAGPLYVSAENAERKTETFGSTAKPNQEIRLTSTPFLDGSLSIVAANGTFTRVDTFLDSDSTDRHFTVVVDSNDRATVRFGNGINGVIPTGTISATYKIGGGSAGYVEPGSVRRIEGVFVDSLGNSITVSVTNALASSRALNRQTVEEIRVLAPESLRALTRTVTRDDYEINARRVAGVARALMLTSDQDAGVSENAGSLYIVPTGGGVPTLALKAAVLEMVTVTYPNTLTFAVTVEDPVYLVVNVEAIVWFASGANKVATRNAIEAALVDVFAIEDVETDDESEIVIDFGYNLRDEDGNPNGAIAWSDVFNVIRDVSGVRKVDAGSSGLLLNGARDDLAILSRQFPILGTVTIRDGSTGLVVS
jgi:hypothetical protein